MAIFFIVIFILVWFAIVAGAAFTMPVMTNFFPGQEGMTIVGIINLLFTIGIPLLAVVLLIVRVSFRRKIHVGWVVGLGAFWLLNAIALAGIGGTLAQEFVAEDSITDNIDIQPSIAGADTLLLGYYELTDTPQQRFSFGGDEIELPGAKVRFYVEKSTDGTWSLARQVSARARTENAARSLASGLVVPLKQNTGELSAPWEIPFGELEKWRDQEVRLTVHAPVGAYLRLNRNDVRASYVPGPVAYDKLRETEVYQVLENGRLQCLSCPAVEKESGSLEQSDEVLGLLSAGGYERVTVSGPIKLTIEQGEEFDVRINGPKAYLDRLEQEVADGELKLNLAAERTGRPVRIYLTMPTLTAVRLEGTEDVRIKDMDTAELAIYASSRSTIKLDGDIGRLQVRLEDVAELEFTGSAEHLSAELRDLSRMDTDRGRVQTAELDLKNQSRAKLKETVSIQTQNVSEGSQLRLVD